VRRSIYRSALWRALAVLGLFLAVAMLIWITGGGAQAAEGGGSSSLWSDLPRWANMVISIGGLALLLLTLYLSTRFAPKAGLDAAQLRQAEIEKRLDRVEARLETLPDRDQVHRLALDMERQSGELRALTATIRPLGASVTRIEEWLINKGDRRS